MHVEKVFNDYWKPILKERGVDPNTVSEPIKCILYDYHFLQEQALKVYEEVTGGRVDSLTWAGWAIIEEYKKNLKSMRDQCNVLPVVTQEDIDALSRSQHEQLQIQSALNAIEAVRVKRSQDNHDTASE